jgi:hypothetical protein
MQRLMIATSRRCMFQSMCTKRSFSTCIIHKSQEQQPKDEFTRLIASRLLNGERSALSKAMTLL